MTLVRPAWPFPPHGGEPEGVVDLGVRLRDAIFRRQNVERQVRPALFERLTRALASGDGGRAADLVEAVLDTWPMVVLIDDARRRWTRGPDAAALGVLARCGDLTALSTGTEAGWPRPGSGWVRRMVGNRIGVRVERLHREDGSEAIAAALEAPVVDAPPPARVVVTPIPWPALLAPAPPGPAGERPAARVRVIQLPGTPRGLRSGRTELTSWIVWENAHPAMPVTEAGAAVLQLADGTRTPADIARNLDAPIDQVESVVRALAQAGAFKIPDPGGDRPPDPPDAD